MKLPKNTLSEEELSRLESLIIENKDMNIFSDFFRDYIDSVLEEKQVFESKNLLRLENISALLENCSDVTEFEEIIRQENISNILVSGKSENISYFAKGKTIQEFSILCNHYSFGEMIMYGNIKNLKKVMEYFGDIDILLSLGSNSEDVLDTFSNADPENIAQIFTLKPDSEQLKQFVEIPGIYEVLIKWKPEELNKFLTIFLTMDELISFVDKGVNLAIIRKWRNVHIFSILDLCKSKQDIIDAVESNTLNRIAFSRGKTKILPFIISKLNEISDLIGVLNDPEFQSLLALVNDSENLKIAFSLCVRVEDFLLLAHDSKITQVLQHGKSIGLEYIIELYQIDSIQQFRDVVSEKGVYNFLKLVNIDILYSLRPLMTHIDDFEYFMHTDAFKNIMRHSECANIDYLVTDIYSIKNIQQLCEILEDPRIRKFVYEGRWENSELLMEQYGLHDSFEDLVSNKDILAIIIDFKPDNLKIALEGSEHIKDLDKIQSDITLYDTLKHANSSNMELFIEKFSVKGIDGLMQFSNNSEVTRLLRSANNSNLKLFLELCSDINDFIEILDNNIISVLSKVDNTNLDLFMEYIDNISDFQNLCSNEIIRKILKDGETKKIYAVLSMYDDIKLLKNALDRGHHILYFVSACDMGGYVPDVCYLPGWKKFIITNVFRSKNNIDIFFNQRILGDQNCRNLLSFLVKYKKKHVFKYMSKIKTLQDLNIPIDNEFLRINFLSDLENQNLGVITEEARFNNISNNFKTYLNLSNDKGREKKIRKMNNLIKTKNFEGIEQLYGEIASFYFSMLATQEIEEKVLKELEKEVSQRGIDLDNMDLDRAMDIDFIEAFKFSINPDYNKVQIKNLLIDYLLGKFDNISQLKQYDTENNQRWLGENLTQDQKGIWLGENKKEISIDPDMSSASISSNKNSSLRINHHIRVAIDKIDAINELGFEFTDGFQKAGGWVNYFDTVIKKQQDEIIKKKGGQNLFEDLKLQIEAAKKLFKSGKGKKSSSVIISREQDPMKSLMMGNWVDDSCLSYYSSIGNYYSAIANTIDVNKGVYYIRDENGKILGRCLVTIGNDSKISRYNMYYNGNVSLPIDDFFDEYIIELANNLGLELNGDQDFVEEIESDDWYKDGVKKVEII